MDYRCFTVLLTTKGIKRRVFNGSTVEFCHDYYKIKIEQIAGILSEYNEQLRWIKSYSTVLDVKLPIIPIMEEYQVRKRLTLTYGYYRFPYFNAYVYMFMVAQHSKK